MVRIDTTQVFQEPYQSEHWKNITFVDEQFIFDYTIILNL